MKLFPFLSAMCAIPLMAGIAEPRAGVMLARDRSVREVAGVAGAFVGGGTLAASASRAASSGKFMAIKLEASIRVTGGGEFDAPAGDAVFGFDREGTVAYAYYPSNRTFVRVGADGVNPLPVDADLLGGDVVALSGALTVWVRRDDGIHAIAVRLSDGAIESDTATTGAAATLAVALGDGALVYVRGSAIVIRDAAGSEREVEVPGAVAYMALMGAEWVQVRIEGQSMALRVRASATALVYLPEVPE